MTVSCACLIQESVPVCRFVKTNVFSILILDMKYVKEKFDVKISHSTLLAIRYFVWLITFGKTGEIIIIIIFIRTCWQYGFLWLYLVIRPYRPSFFATPLDGTLHWCIHVPENITCPAQLSMSCSCVLDSFCDEKWVAVQLLLWRVILPGFVQRWAMFVRIYLTPAPWLGCNTRSFSEYYNWLEFNF